MSKNYDHKKIERKWQEVWEKTGIYEAKDDVPDEKLYHLVMFPYSSGDLHMGHWYNYSGADFRARYMRMNDYNILNPIGFDSFGLPAENAAIKNKIPPKKWTDDNIANMRKQLKSTGASFDWGKEIITSSPEYYKWTQWMFLFMYKNRLAYKKKVFANWCPKCQTVLANEQVVGTGVCERCESEVVQKELEQWLFKITDYAERLLSDLDKINWPEKIKAMQRNWIGKSEGSEIEFQIKDTNLTFRVFTTRPDTLFGATFMVFAPEHSFIEKLKDKIKNYKEVEGYVEKAKKKSEFERGSLVKQKTGIEIEGISVVNPANNKEIPIYVADFVLGSYGTGAIMSVPAHDERDYEFAIKFKIPIIPVVEQPRADFSDIHIYDNDNSELAMALRNIGTPEERVTPTVQIYRLSKSKFSEAANLIREFKTGKGNDWKRISDGEGFILENGKIDFLRVYTGDGEHINSGFLNDLNNKKAIQEMNQWLKKRKIGGKEIHYHLRDWLVSRQRYWGAPVPIINCEKCGEVPVPEKDLPVLLPENVEFKLTGESPLKYSEEFVNTKCPKCGGSAKRETDTMDTFVCSSWYFLRYCDSKNDKEFASKTKMKKWLPVDMYIGGAEHAVLHLLYSRFFTKALKDKGYLWFSEPFLTLVNQGTILGPDGQKMSKSKGNIIDPDKLVQEEGADAVRMYLGFMGPYDQGGPWDPKGFSGISRFLNRVRGLFEAKIEDSESDLAETRLLNKTIKKVGEDVEGFRFNTAISALMVLVNGLSKAKTQHKKTLEILTLLLAPFAPHIAEELWEKLGNKESVHVQSWPGYDPKMLEEDIAIIVVQVNGKVRANIEMPKGADQKIVGKEALANEKIQKHLAGKKPKKIIYVPGKILNIVT